MNKLLTFILIGLLFSNCSNDGDVDCETYDPAVPSLYLKLVDSSGNNLIANGTFDPDEITLLSGVALQFLPAKQFAVPDADIRAVDNTFLLSIPNNSSFEYKIQLNDTKIISLQYSAKKEDLLCGLSYFVPTGARLDNEPFELKDIFGGSVLTEIVL